MMADDEGLRESVLAAFLARYHADREAGHSLGAAAYFALFPGHEELIQQELAALEAGDSTMPWTDHARPETDRIGPYRIVRELGRGGQAVVYLAEDVRLPRSVALKVLRGSFADERARQRLRREAEFAARVDHPGIGTIYEVGEADGATWIAMRFVPGRSLAAWIAEIAHPSSSSTTSQFMSFADSDDSDDSDAQDGKRETGDETPSTSTTRGHVALCLDIFEKVARAAHAAHEGGLVHRDIKPANILLTEALEPVIVDFGLALDAAGEGVQLTATGDLLGTPAYMSPEQLTAQRIPVDRRTDVYSLGVSLYEALTLRRPFQAPTRHALLQQILAAELPRARGFNPAISRDLDVVLATALEKDRNRRYQTAHDIAEDLRRVRTGRPILARPAGPWLRAQRWARRNPTVAVSLVVLSAALGFTSWALVRAHREAVRADRGESAARRAQTTAERLLELAGRLGRLRRLAAERDGRVDALRSTDAESVAEARTWLADAHSLLAELEPLTKKLEELRGRALVQDERDRLRDRRLDARYATADELRRRIDALAERRDRLEDDGAWDTADTLDRALVELEGRYRGIETEVAARHTWSFATSEDQAAHQTLTALVSGLEEIRASGIVADLERFISRAEYEREVSLVRYRPEWDRAVAAVADPKECPCYDGLGLRPICGLVPIGRDPASDLWEFAHPASGGIPRRDERGRLVLEAHTCLVFVLLPGGSFMLGAVAGDGATAIAETPARAVTLAPFLLSKFEMTQAQWQELAGFNPSTWVPGMKAVGDVETTALHPVENVSWDAAVPLLRRFSLDLPTEAQWEYAARAGTRTIRYTGDALESLRGHVNVADRTAQRFGTSWASFWRDLDDGYVATAPVGTFLPNPFGLHDVFGNVWEWCRDGSPSYADVLIHPADGLLESTFDKRTVRGGGYPSDARYLRASARVACAPCAPDPGFGLRPIRILHHE